MEQPIAPPLRPVVGDSAPDVMVSGATDAPPIPLSSVWKEGPALLVFLRHLGCMFCREHVAMLRADQATFERLHTRVALVTLNTPDSTIHFCADRVPNATFVCLSDQTKYAYQAYGLSRTNTRDLFLSPHIYSKGFQAALHGHFASIPTVDPFQMPGVFIVDRTGIIRYAHRHKDAADNPPNSTLIEVLESLKSPNCT